jgi:hypothetical protein
MYLFAGYLPEDFFGFGSSGISIIEFCLIWLYLAIASAGTGSPL